MKRKSTTTATKAKAERAAAAQAKLRRIRTKPKAEVPAVTEEAIVKARDEDQLSWRQVAITLGLGSPGAARKAYTELTGRDYRDSAITKRAPRGTGSSSKATLHPEWNNKTDHEEIKDALFGRTIEVERQYGTEPELIRIGGGVTFVTKTKSGKRCPLTVEFQDRDTLGYRAIRVADIRAVR